VVCQGPRVPGEMVGPRPLSRVVVRPLNFTVRGRFTRGEAEAGWSSRSLRPRHRALRPARRYGRDG
jgi:hypothetical protein